MKYRLLKICLLTVVFAIFATDARSQVKRTFLYAVKDTNKLYLDVYLPEKQNDRNSCLFFVFGGGYIIGARNDSQIQEVKRHYTELGYVVIGIDYRLGLKNATNFNILTGVKNYERAVVMAAEDLISAIAYTLDSLNNKHITINPDNVLVMGSSAGAITALQADYGICNGFYNADILPDSFHLAGVISYSGAIFSTKGGPKYKKHAPAPTLFCHGDKDRLVIYNHIQFCNLGLFGSDYLVKRFKKNGWGYQIRRHKGLGHQVAGFFPQDFELIDSFIESIVFGNRTIQIDETYYDPSVEPLYMNFKVRDLEKFK